MSEAVRYAIYLAPSASSVLWQFGSRILGYDAETTSHLPGFELPSMPPIDWFNATARARQYGFHATLKAPFRLAEGFSEKDLIEDLAAFSGMMRDPIKVTLHLEVLDHTQNGGFLALVPEEPYDELHELEASVVKGLDHFRAPLSKQEYAKRQPEKLNQRQLKYLTDYGYPFVLEEFRAHFTLSDRLANADIVRQELQTVMDPMADCFEFRVNELVLFQQPSAASNFRIVARCPFSRGQFQ